MQGDGGPGPSRWLKALGSSLCSFADVRTEEWEDLDLALWGPSTAPSALAFPGMPDVLCLQVSLCILPS